MEEDKKLSFFSLSVEGGGRVWLSSVAAEALRTKQMAGDRFSSLLHHLHMWLRFEYTNFDAVRQKKKICGRVTAATCILVPS